MVNKLPGNLCVLLPTVNELRNLEVLIPQLQETFPRATILVVDDGSIDGSHEYLEKLQHQSTV